MRPLWRFRRLIFFVMGLVFCLTLYLLVNTTPPTRATISLFMFIVLVASFYIFRSLLNRNLRAFIYASAITLILFLRVLELKHWLYVILILALAVAIDAYVRHT